MLKNLLSSLILVHLYKGTASQCDSSWSERNGYCYYVTPSSVENTYTWHTARQWCMERGADLASIENIEEQNFITQKATENGNTGSLWIGLNQLKDKNSSYIWSDGSSSTYRYYAAGQPAQKHGMQQCIYTRTVLNDGDCFTRKDGFSTIKGLIEEPEDASPPETYHFGHMSEDEEGIAFCKDECGKEMYCHSYTFVSTLSPDPIWAGQCMGRNDANDIEVRDVWSYSGVRVPCRNQLDTGMWYSHNCGVTNGLVCKKRVGSHIPLTTPTTQHVPSYCPQYYYSIRNGNKCFKVVTGTHDSLDRLRTWDDALLSCRSGPGINPDLASVSSDLENAEILAALQGYVHGVWLGYHVEDRSGVYVWADNSHTGYTNWAEDKPSEVGGTCAQMVVSPGTPGTWANYNCGDRLGYVCQTYKDPDKPINQPPLTTPVYCKQGWTPYWYACYRIETKQLNFADADHDCFNQGGRLVSIQSEVENSAITVITADTVPMWIGLHKLSGYYVWTDDWQVRYYNWADGYPNEEEGECVSMTENGKWKNTDCSMTRSYMCKYAEEKAITTPVHELGDCPNEQWYRWGKYCYYFDTESSTSWQAARESCVDRTDSNFTVDLVSIHSFQENEMLINELNQREDSNNRGPAWIGMKRENSGGEFSWSDGSTVGYTLWYPGEPNIDNQYLCGSMVHGQYMGSWMPEDCETGQKFVCKTQKTPNTGATTSFTTAAMAKDKACCNAGQVIGITLASLLIIAFVGLVGFFIFRYFIQPHRPGGTGLSPLDKIYFRNPLSKKNDGGGGATSVQTYQDLAEEFTVNDVDPNVRKATLENVQQNPTYFNVTQNNGPSGVPNKA